VSVERAEEENTAAGLGSVRGFRRSSVSEPSGTPVCAEVWGGGETQRRDDESAVPVSRNGTDVAELYLVRTADDGRRSAVCRLPGAKHDR